MKKYLLILLLLAAACTKRTEPVSPKQEPQLPVPSAHAESPKIDGDNWGELNYENGYGTINYDGTVGLQHASAPDKEKDSTGANAGPQEYLFEYYTVGTWETDEDCLWNIALREYGDSDKYIQIYEYNRDRIEDPELIYTGQTIRLPR